MVDLERVTSLNRPACNLFSFLARKLASKRRTLIFTRVNSVFAQTLRSALRSRGPEESPNHPPFKDVDFAMEWCENCILADSTASGKAITNTLEMLEASRFELLAGLAQSELDLISEAITVEAYAGGEHIVQAGAERLSLFAAAAGPGERGNHPQVRSRGPAGYVLAGMSFGEMALIGNRRSATVADTSVQCLVLDVAPLARIWADNPRLKAVMMENLACDIGRKLRRTNETIQYTRKMTRTHRAVQGQL